MEIISSETPQYCFTAGRKCAVKHSTVMRRVSYGLEDLAAKDLLSSH